VTTENNPKRGNRMSSFKRKQKAEKRKQKQKQKLNYRGEGRE
jgi:hypothetical protein